MDTQAVIIEAMADQITRLKARVTDLEATLAKTSEQRDDFRRALSNICGSDEKLKAMYGYLLNEHSTP